MKFGCLALMCGIPLAMTSGARADESVATRSALVALQKSSKFGTGGVSYSAELSSGEVAVRALARQKNASALFVRALEDKNTSNAGRLYALLGLRWIESAEFQRCAGPLMREKTSVEVFMGCIVSTIPVDYLAYTIQGGKYPRPLELERYFFLTTTASRMKLFQPRELRDSFVLSSRENTRSIHPRTRPLRWLTVYAQRFQTPQYRRFGQSLTAGMADRPAALYLARP